ncbi:hypothetical protein HanIR_Chr02g0069991 [Helianthus annuus]|nr:hypothetical protein HanIR_Chr02g0069991 [Helianthus annuus]
MGGGIHFLNPKSQSREFATSSLIHRLIIDNQRYAGLGGILDSAYFFSGLDIYSSKARYSAGSLITFHLNSSHSHFPFFSKP